MRHVSVDRIVGSLLAVALLGLPAVASGQEASDRTYGIVSPVIHTVTAMDFGALQSTMTFGVGGVQNRSRFCTGLGCVLVAGLRLPEGVVISKLELEACDADNASEVRAILISLGPNESDGDSLVEARTGDPDTPGCARFAAPVVPPHRVDNANRTYVLNVVTGVTESTRFQAVRVSYNLDVSPAPGVATFADVPTGHPFFQFIEALWAARITTGCSATPLLFCPDDPLTRGQAAVLFGKALGLHFSP